ncbi:MAG: stage 0 sporulation protein, partial [Firmicutes bacterium]|nr:stage 0 sporulation protein [Candidatus Caballimonas caccae]
MAKIIGVKFKNTAKVYYFAPIEGVNEYPKDSGVIVETAKGLEYGTVVFGLKEVSEDRIVHPLKPIIRRATEKDEKTRKEYEAKIPETLEKANQTIIKSKLDMKLVGAEYS